MTDNIAQSTETQSIGMDATLLLVDDDGPFLRRLARAMEARGFTVEKLQKAWPRALAKAKANTPKYAVVDMRLQDGNGLDVIEAIRERRDDNPHHRADRPTATSPRPVTAVKLGAIDYLAKPADADEVFAALTRKPGERAEVPENPMSADRVPLGTYPEGSTRIVRAQMCRKPRGSSTCTGGPLQRILAKRAPALKYTAAGTEFTPDPIPPTIRPAAGVRGGAGKSQQHGLARRGGETVFRGLAQHVPRPVIGDESGRNPGGTIAPARRHGWRRTAGRSVAICPAICDPSGSPRRRTLISTNPEFRRRR